MNAKRLVQMVRHRMAEEGVEVTPDWIVEKLVRDRNVQDPPSKMGIQLVMRRVYYHAPTWMDWVDSVIEDRAAEILEKNMLDRVEKERSDEDKTR